MPFVYLYWIFVVAVNFYTKPTGVERQRNTPKKKLTSNRRQNMGYTDKAPKIAARKERSYLSPYLIWELQLLLCKTV
jgi:hypothetical protein